jgi:hypothetical protein
MGLNTSVQPSAETHLRTTERIASSVASMGRRIMRRSAIVEAFDRHDDTRDSRRPLLGRGSRALVARLGRSVMESLEAAIRRHLPDAEVHEDDGSPWSAASCRARLEGQTRADVRLNFGLEGARVFGAAVAFQREGKQFSRIVVVGFPP